jgi:O-antigen/teichoic acid export membrane protein
MAAPIGFYALAHLLTSSLDLLILRVILGSAQEATVGLYLAALNIARVPAFALSSITAVLLPSVSRASARQIERSSSAISTKHCASFSSCSCRSWSF